MEYIEPKPKEVKPHERRNKLIIGSVIGAALTVGIVLTYFFTIKDIFLDYDNIEIFSYSYKTDEVNSGVTITAIDDNAVLPAKFRIPNKLSGRPVVEIADGVFSKQTTVEEIVFPDTLRIIGEECFLDCESLARFNIPSQLETIGNDAFKNTSWLINADDGEVAVGRILYAYKGEMMPDSAIVKDMSSPAVSAHSGDIVDFGQYINAADGAFKDQANLVYAEFPNTFLSVSDSLFENCISLESLTFPANLESIGNNSFSGCTSLTDLSLIPETVKNIGNYAFAYTKLSGELAFSEKLESVGVGAFMYCDEITKVTIPSDFEYIPDYLFDNCTSLSQVIFHDSEYTADSKINYIGDGSFRKTAISNFHVPFNATSIKTDAFEECPNLTTIYTLNNINGEKQNIRILNQETGEYYWSKSDSTYQGLLVIGASVFKNAPVFENLILVNSDNEVVSALNEFTCPVTLSSLGGTNNDAYLLTGTNVKTLNLGKDTSGVTNADYLKYLVGDASSSGHVVAVLPPSLCENATALKNVNFGGEYSTIKTINRAAFKGCVGLETIIINDSVTTLETNIFENCTSLKNVTLPNRCDSITTRSFYGCSALETITIPASYKTIGQEAFAQCIKLASINFVDFKVTNIGLSAFQGDVALTSFTFGNSCNAIANSIFSGCTSLTNITLSTDWRIDTVKSSMFENATSLASIKLPSNYHYIAEAAFKGCIALKSITLEATQIVTFKSNSFDGVTLTHIYVPATLVESYKTDLQWSAYASIIEAIPTI